MQKVFWPDAVLSDPSPSGGRPSILRWSRAPPGSWSPRPPTTGRHASGRRRTRPGLVPGSGTGSPCIHPSAMPSSSSSEDEPDLQVRPMIARGGRARMFTSISHALKGTASPTCPTPPPEVSVDRRPWDERGRPHSSLWRHFRTRARSRRGVPDGPWPGWAPRVRSAVYDLRASSSRGRTLGLITAACLLSHRSRRRSGRCCGLRDRRGLRGDRSAIIARGVGPRRSR